MPKEDSQMKKVEGSPELLIYHANHAPLVSMAMSLAAHEALHWVAQIIQMDHLVKNVEWGNMGMKLDLFHMIPVNFVLLENFL